MSDVVLGIAPTEQSQRDAIHVAVIPVIANEELQPGQRVRLTDRDMATAGEPAIGIVDPYLRENLSKGERFWLCLLPNTVRGMRHHWSHPAFDASTQFRESEAWLRDYANYVNHNYFDPEVRFSRLLEDLRDKSLCFYGDEQLYCHADVPQSAELCFHAETYLGIKINFDDFVFSCSC